MKYGIVGSRKRNTNEDLRLVYDKFLDIALRERNAEGEKEYQYGTHQIVSGGTKYGADRFAEVIAKDNGLPIMVYNADWKALNNSAGPIRNTFIAKDSDILLACVSSDRTGGTEDTITKFQKFHPNGELIIV